MRVLRGGRWTVLIGAVGVVAAAVLLIAFPDANQPLVTLATLVTTATTVTTLRRRGQTRPNETAPKPSDELVHGQPMRTPGRR